MFCAGFAHRFLPRHVTMFRRGAGMENQAAQEAKKPCIACGEMIPAQAVVCSHCLQRQTPEKSNPMKLVMNWVGYTTATLGLLATLMGGARWLNARHKQQAEIKTEMALADSQMQQAEYDSAVHTYQDILQKDPQNQKAADEELNTVMLWVENFHAMGSEAHPPEQVAALELDQILPLLEAARVRVHGQRAADVLAHLGWAHFMNAKIAFREHGSAPQDNLRAALMTDPSNVYANAMLGNLLLQTGGSFPEAINYFAAAAATGKARPMVRTMQIYGLAGYEVTPGARRELVKLANEMRKNGEPLDDGEKDRIDSFAYSFNTTTTKQLEESLSAVPPDESWTTYLWIDQAASKNDEKEHSMEHEFISARLLEITGKRAEALQEFRALQKELKGYPTYSLNEAVGNAIRRLA
jgi:tetratricopeptide (TPR) repeat protein